jgi:M6 family metalloprotease-like protein
MKTKMYLTMLMLTVLSLWTATLQAAELKKANLVCFVRFADETNGGEDGMFVDHPFSYYEQLFNDNTVGAQSVYNYFKHSSYGQLDWTTSFFPAASGEQVMSYQAQQPRGYYQEKTSINTIGWEDATTMAARERGLMKEIISYIDQNIDKSVVVDADGDGLLDNLTIVVSSCSQLGSRHMLWPHRSDLVSATNEFMINNAKVVGYLLVFDEYRSQLTAPTTLGVICHETSHSLGTYDLYHVNDKLNPVGVWDLMSDNQDTPQQMTVYTKYRYCKWGDLADIPTISTPGTYELNPVGGTTQEKIAYKIQPVGNDKEYFMVEYRKKEGYDSSIPASGLLIYRINTNFSGGNVGYNGTTRLDEQYIFRPGGTTTADGTVTNANFSQESGRKAFGGLADEKPFYSDGTVANFAIGNVSACGETITFDLLETTKQLILSESELTLKGSAQSGASVTVASDEAWTITGVPTWLTVTPASGNAGTTTVNLSANEDNTTGALRSVELTVSSTSDPSLYKTLTVHQEAKSSNVILFDDFENTENPNGWVIENSGLSGTGWQYCTGTTTGKAKQMTNSGTHALLMKEAYIGGAHQLSMLTSKEFANATAFSFYSLCIGGNMTPTPKPTYTIEVSSDGGTTWTQIFDVLTDYPRDTEGKTVNILSYTKISFDLTPYKSEHMKIRFHCADADNDGLAYWWQIDDLEITGEGTTAIRDVHNADSLQPVIYDLQGRRMTQSGKGIYIINGKKVIR